MAAAAIRRTQLTATHRYGAKRGEKTKAARPASQTGAEAGPSARISCTRNEKGENGMFLVAASAAVWATNGQPFAACQRRFGAAITMAITTAAHGCHRASRRRCGVARRPSAIETR